MNIFRLVLMTTFLCLASGGLAKGGDLSAGVGRVEITPPAGYAMGGYNFRPGPSKGVHDPLYATVVVLRAGGTTVAIVACDLRSFPSERIVRITRERGLADHVLISVSHTHSGPLTWEDKSWPSSDKSWFAGTEDRIINAIEEASAKMFPARIAAGSGEIYLGHNRRKVDESGKTTMLWRNAEKVPTSPIDPTVGVIRIDDQTGTPRAVLVNYACHAVILGPDNLAISADYPGYMARKIEKDFPGALCLFIQGGAGDINPYLDKQPVSQNGFGEAEKMGLALAEEALKVTRRLKPKAAPNAAIKAASEVVEYRDRWDDRKKVRAGLTTLMINNDIAIATMPGEPFVDLQIALRDKSEIPNTFLFGYTYSAGGEWVGYIPTIRAAVEGGYGAGYNTRLEVGAGESMVDRAIVKIFQFLGKLKGEPSVN
ncbi:MAG: neutral/alkaline non-lysosomal ceramidase N-terminal domain-containing protein [Acidobacteria bacterium]|nr:neutral/alkaline non-lysosomal ceramidase N-terminal domain-containing protein [Acidobacteriota bacterium]